MELEPDSGITCTIHGIYGNEWPYYTECPWCVREAAIRKEEQLKVESIQIQLEEHQRAILKIRKALTGDIHSESNLLEDIANLKLRTECLENFVADVTLDFHPAGMTPEEILSFYRTEATTLQEANRRKKR